MNQDARSAINVIDRHNAELVDDDRPEVDDALVEEDLLVEEVSIDGMCGVY